MTLRISILFVVLLFAATVQAQEHGTKSISSSASPEMATLPAELLASSFADEKKAPAPVAKPDDTVRAPRPETATKDGDGGQFVEPELLGYWTMPDTTTSTIARRFAVFLSDPSCTTQGQVYFKRLTASTGIPRYCIATGSPGTWQDFASGTVTSFSAGDLSPLFTTTETNPTTTPALSFTLSNAAPHKFFGNNTGSTAAPGFQSIGTGDLPAGISAANLVDGTVSDAELQFINTLSSNAQTQIDGKQSLLTNSAGLRGALSDESGTGVALFDGATGFTVGTFSASSIDLPLLNPVGNTIEQRNGTNAQVFEIYRTYTSGSNYERLFAGWSAGAMLLGTEGVGASLSNPVLNIGGSGTGALNLYTNNTNRLTIGGSSGIVTVLTNSAVSSPGVTLVGTWFSGGSATTTKPYFLIEPIGTTSTGWGTGGTGIGVNAPSGFAGNLMDLELNGVSVLKATSGSVLVFGTNASLSYLAASILQFGGSGGGSGGSLLAGFVGVGAAYSGVTIGSTRMYGFSPNAGDPNAVDTNFSRKSAGVARVGTTAQNSLGDLELGNVISTVAGKGLQLQSGTGARGGELTLVGGTVTVTNTTVASGDVLLLTRKTSGGTIGTAITYTLSAGASFTVTSDNILETSTFSYMLVKVN